MLAASLLPGMAAAQTTVYHFGQNIAGDGAPAALDFATLSVTQSGNDLVFSLSSAGLDQFNGSQPFLSALAIDGDMVGTITAVSGDAPVSLAKGGGPDGSWEFRFDFTGKKKDRLTDDESVEWTWVGGAGHFNGIGAHVQGLDYGNTTSSWYQALAVPEPGSGAMFLSGLLLLAWWPARQRLGKRLR